MTARSFFSTAALAALALAAGACTGDFDFDIGGGPRVESSFHKTLDLKPGAHLDLETFNGTVEIRGWDQSSADISAVKYANSTTLRDLIKIEIVNGPDNLSIRTVRPPDHHGNMGARYVVRVPRQTVLDRIVSSNGSIRVEDIDGRVSARTSNSSINVTHVKGDLDATTSNGSIEVADLTGNATLHSSNAHIQADHVAGAVEAESSNGSIHLGFDQEPKNGVRADTSNSGIEVSLPSSSAFRIRASTSNGTITSDFPVTAQGESSKTHMEGTVNGGGPLLDLTTNNGSIHVSKP